jgi:hypothetical protein
MITRFVGQAVRGLSAKHPTQSTLYMDNMNTKRSRIIGFLAVGLLYVCGSSYASSITYTLDIPKVGDLTVAGTITTDGNMGPLTVADITSFDFSEDSPSIPYTASFSPSDVQSDGFSMFGVGADATGLYINSSAAGGGYLVIEVTGGPGQYSYVNPIVLPGNGIGHYSDCTASCLENSVRYNVTQDDSSHLVNPYDVSGLTYFATNGVASVAPEPDTYALMFVGLMLVGVVARRRCVTRRASL